MLRALPVTAVCLTTLATALVLAQACNAARVYERPGLALDAEYVAPVVHNDPNEGGRISLRVANTDAAKDLLVYPDLTVNIRDEFGNGYLGAVRGTRESGGTAIHPREEKAWTIDIMDRIVPAAHTLSFAFSQGCFGGDAEPVKVSVALDAVRSGDATRRRSPDRAVLQTPLRTARSLARGTKYVFGEVHHVLFLQTFDKEKGYFQERMDQLEQDSHYLRTRPAY